MLLILVVHEGYYSAQILCCIGINDPWGKPPSYDAITSPQHPEDPWVPPVTTSTNNSGDPFGGKDPFSTSPPTSTDPWKPAPVSPTISPTFGGDDFVSSSTESVLFIHYYYVV